MAGTGTEVFGGRHPWGWGSANNVSKNRKVRHWLWSCLLPSATHRAVGWVVLWWKSRRGWCQAGGWGWRSERPEGALKGREAWRLQWDRLRRNESHPAYTSQGAVLQDVAESSGLPAGQGHSLFAFLFVIERKETSRGTEDLQPSHDKCLPQRCGLSFLGSIWEGTLSPGL